MAFDWKTTLSSPSSSLLVYVNECVWSPVVSLRWHFLDAIHLAFIRLFFQTVFTVRQAGQAASHWALKTPLSLPGNTGLQVCSSVPGWQASEPWRPLCLCLAIWGYRCAAQCLTFLTGGFEDQAHNPPLAQNALYLLRYRYILCSCFLTHLLERHFSVDICITLNNLLIMVKLPLGISKSNAKTAPHISFKNQSNNKYLWVPFRWRII